MNAIGPDSARYAWGPESERQGLLEALLRDEITFVGPGNHTPLATHAALCGFGQLLRRLVNRNHESG